MARSRTRQSKKAGPPRRRLVRLPLLALVIGSCSTIPGAGGEQLILAASIPIPEPAAAVPLADAAAEPLLTGDAALHANAALPLAFSGEAAPSMIFASAAPIARMRAHDCLAQAIYYEARSESEEGQRAVAQVVLNRVRHPAWPNSVCGVVYQGPMRAGGGCQFTFTCDGSLAHRPYGADWMRARRLAGEALSGRVFEPVGLSTFYHANYVMPRWAPRLLKTAVIGAHLFYRLPGAGSASFSDAYAGVEPIARPNPITVRYNRARAVADVPALAVWAAPLAGAAAPLPAVPAARIEPAPEAALIADSQVRPEYRQSGQWREDAPAAISGR